MKKYSAISAELAELVQSESRIPQLELGLRVGPGMQDLAKFEGRLTRAACPDPSSGNMQEIEMPEGGAEITASTKGNAQVLLRECRLRNCSHAYGIAIYTGPKTFIKQQSKKTSVKPVFLQSSINSFVRWMLLGQVGLCLIGAIRYAFFTDYLEGRAWYLQSEGYSLSDTVLRFFTFVQVTSNLIPISLYVSMEMARLAQKFFMERDDDMYHVTSSPNQENIPARVRASQLNDQLGQVTHIFSDKTGTLTANSFEFRKLSVGGFTYGSGTTEIAVISARGQARSEADRREVEKKEAILQLGIENMKRPGKIPHVNFVEEEHCERPLMDVVKGETPTVGPFGEDASARHRRQIHEMFLSFILCSTVDIEPGAGNSEAAYRLAGDSSDEICFCYAAFQFGYRLVCRTYTASGEPAYEIEYTDYSEPESSPNRTKRTRRILGALNEFNSARGMMSTVIDNPELPEDHPERVVVYAKGSDKMILQCLFQLKSTEELDRAIQEASTEEEREEARRTKERHEEQRWMREQTGNVIGEFSKDGLRTLAFARRPIARSEFLAWRPRVREARQRGKEIYEAHLNEFPGDEAGAEKKKKIEVSRVIGEVEKNMEYQGVVGYEDSLQEDVPNTISRLTDAGIKVYMLTGDKEGTAINIGYGTQMLTNESEVLSLTWDSRDRELFNPEDPDTPVEERVGLERSLLREVRAAVAAGHSTVDADADPDLDWEDSTEAGSPGDHSFEGDEDGRSTGSPTVISRDSEGHRPLHQRTPGRKNDGEANGAHHHGEVAVDVHKRAPFGYRRLEHPDVLSVVRTLCPVRSEETSRVDPGHQQEALGLVRALLAELKAAEAAIKDFREETNRKIKEEIRNSVVEFVLLLDLTLLMVKYAGGSSKPLALVLDEKSMNFLAGWPGYEEILANRGRFPKGLESESLIPQKMKRTALLQLAESCSAIIGARCQPSQKRMILELIKFEVPENCCLAIGDGANDVEMINASHVGVGIQGLEGNSAANAADYSIGQFRYLQKLLLVHGRWNYMRMCVLILFMFWKNALFTFAQFLFGEESAWSGQKIYPEAAAQGYNIFFTGVAVIIAASMDQDVDADSAQRFPYLYSAGRLRRHFNVGLALLWIGQAILEGGLILVFTTFAMVVAEDEGYAMSVFEFGSIVLTYVVAVVNLRLAVEVFQHELLFILGSFLSTASWPALAFLIDRLDHEGTRGSMTKVFGSGMFWMGVPIVLALILFPTFLRKIVATIFVPEYRTLVRETEMFIRGNQQSSDFFPMVESAETREKRRRGERVNRYNRELVRSNTPFDRRNRLTKIFVAADKKMKMYRKRKHIAGDPRPAVPEVGDLRWSEQEARLLLAPIGRSLREKLRSEERTRLAYPFHFYYNLSMRKRIQNLVQQGRLTAASVGLQSFPDDDVVMGVYEAGDSKGHEEEPHEPEEQWQTPARPSEPGDDAAAGAGALGGDTVAALGRHTVGESPVRIGSVDEGASPRRPASRWRHLRTRSHWRSRLEPMDIRADFTTDEHANDSLAELVLQMTSHSDARRTER